MKYESTILKRLIDTYGVVGNPRYISEIIKEFIVRGKERFPELFTYQADWLAHIDEFGLNPSYTVSYTGHSFYAPNTLESPVKSAILKGSTKYRDIDTGEFLETFEEGRNLELVSVKMPGLTTSKEDGTKTNILTVNEDVVLRGVGEVQDTLDCLTGEVVQNIGEIVLDGSEVWTLEAHNGWQRYRLTIEDMVNIYDYTNPNRTHCDKLVYDVLDVKNSGSYLRIYNQIAIYNNEIVRDVNQFKQWLSQNPITIQYELATPAIKTVDLSILNQNGQNVKQLMSFNGGTHFNTRSLEGSPLPTVSVSVETDLEETLMVCSLEGNTI